MVEKTPRFDLDDYEPGDTDWDHSDLVNFVDEQAIARGPIADRPAEGDYDDEMFFAEDQNILWRWDADAVDWVGVSGKGSESQPLPGTVYRESVSAEERDTGAVHELGPNETLSAAFSDHGGEIIDLAGRVYEVSSLLTLSTSGTTLRNGTIKLADSSDSDLFELATGTTECKIQNVTFDLNGPNNTGAASGDGFIRFYGEDHVFENVAIINGDTRDSASYVVWHDCDYSRFVNGLIANGTQGDGQVRIQGNQNVISNTIIRRNDIIEIAGADNVVVGNQFERNRWGLATISNTRDLTVVGNNIEDNSQEGIRIGTQPNSPTETHLFVGNRIQGNGEEGVHIPSFSDIYFPVQFANNNYKRNGLNGNGTSYGIRIESGSGLVSFDAAAITNEAANDAAGAFYVAGVSDVEVSWETCDPADFNSGIVEDSGTRTRINGTVELSGAPTASNYDAGDAGLEILDTSTPALHKVQQDGSVAGPL